MLSLSISNMDNLCTYLFDLIQNSIQAQASLIELTIIESNQLHIILKDNGFGMDEETLHKATSPFYTTRKTRDVGLGLSFIKMLTEQVDGTFELSSIKNKGTTLKLSFDHHHIDMPEIGDIGEMIYLVSIHQDVKDFIFEYIKDEENYHYHLKEIKDVFNATLQSYSIMKALIASINKEIETLRGKT